MEEKDFSMLNSYFQMYRRLNDIHSTVEEFENFKKWSELEPSVHQLFDVFEKFYSELDAELVSQGIKDDVLKHDFDPKTLTNPTPILNIINNSMLNKSTMGSFLGALGSSWGKQKLAFNNLILHYEMMKIAEEHKNDPDYGKQACETLEQFLEQYNLNMGSLTELINSGNSRVEQGQLDISNKLVGIITDLGKIFRKTKDIPSITSTVSRISTLLKDVKTDTAKVDDAITKLGTVIEKLGAMQEVLKTINDSIAGLGTGFEKSLALLKTSMLEDLKKMFNEELKGPLLEDFKSILVESMKSLLDTELKGPMLDEIKRFMRDEFREELLQEINNLLDKREEERRMARGSFKNWINKHWPKVVAGAVGLTLFFTAGHGLASSIVRGNRLDEREKAIAAYYETINGEGSAEGKTYEELWEFVQSIEKEGHSQEQVDKMNAYDQAITDYNGLMDELKAKFEEFNGEGSAEGKTIEELFAGIKVTEKEAETYVSEIAALYDALIGGDAEEIEQMLAELEGISVKTQEDESKIAGYDGLVGGIAETYTQVTGLDSTGVTPDAMLDAIVGAISTGDELTGRTILLALYSNITNKDGSSMSDDELIAWATSCGLIGDVTLEPESNPDVYVPENE